jgi:hypothetical protein
MMPDVGRRHIGFGREAAQIFVEFYLIYLSLNAENW